MKRSYFLVFLLLSLLSCNRNDNKNDSGTYIKPRIKKQVMGIALDYIKEKVKDSQQSVQENGAVRIGDNQISYIIDPATIVTGLIDKDADEDAIVTITSFRGKFPVKTEHLILIKTNQKFALARVVESDMKILGIKEMIIFTEISKFPSDSPSYGCAICKEVVKFQFRDGNLVKTE
jgi:hypothetical protein